jgi:putative transposase
MTLRKTYARRHHSVAMLHAHLIFCTKYRRQVLTPRVFEALRRSVAQTAHALGLVVEAIEADQDHVHVLFAFPPNLALSTITQRIKGASSRFIRQQRFPDVLKKLWGRHLWAPSYCVVSCGGAPLDVVKRYVDNQNTENHQRRAHFKRARKRARKRATSAERTHFTWKEKTHRPALDPPTEVTGFDRGSG